MKLPKAEQDLEEWQTAVEAGRRDAVRAGCMMARSAGRSH
jgi:hypothetical protein